MKLPVQVTFRNPNRSNEIEKYVCTEADRLAKFYDRIVSCRVAIETLHSHHKGSSYHVRVEVKVPGEVIVVKREPSLSHRALQLGEAEVKKDLQLDTLHKNLRRAINDAFKAAGRQLQDYARRQRGDVKNHTSVPVPLQEQ
jgi:ribosome-associated translation inhibitor RaiA